MRLDLKLNSVTLENFRLFEKLVMDFHPRVTVLIGENGAGKTTLVEGIAKMLVPLPKLIEKIQNLTNEEMDITRKGVFVKKDITIGKKTLFGELKLNYVNNDEKLTIQTLQMDEAHVSTLPSQFHFSGINYLSECMQARNRDEINTIPVLVYYPCEKVENEQKDSNLKRESDTDVFKAYENALNVSAFDFKRFFEWFKWQEDLELRSQLNCKAIAKRAILSMLNDEGDDDKFTDIFVDVSSLDNYHLKLKKRDAELEVSQLSAGEKSLFALVSDIARRLAIANPKCADPLKEGGGIVIIDEIDLHLHPRWQRKIVRKLTEVFPKLQFIFTTHSPLILGSVRSENIRLLDDGKVYDVPETYGQNVGLIIKKIMGVEESIFEQDIKHIFKLLANNSVAAAKEEIAAIEEKSPADIPSLREAKAILRRKETSVQ